MIITKFTDYNIDSPNWFIRTIQQELALRDIKGITNNRVQGINVTGQHPLVQLVGNLVDPNNQVSFAGLLPCISVSENNETEESTTIGQGKRVNGVIDITFVNEIRANLVTMKERKREGIITDNQLTLIENAVSGNKKLLAQVEEFFFRSSVFVSLWANTLEELIVIGDVLRSIVYDLRKYMIARNVIDINITTSKGLVNFNFGKVIYGQETEISFLNMMRNYTVTDEVYEQNVLDHKDVKPIIHYVNTIDSNEVIMYNE